jgi:hypothetical protein
MAYQSCFWDLGRPNQMEFQDFYVLHEVFMHKGLFYLFIYLVVC